MRTIKKKIEPPTSPVLAARKINKSVEGAGLEER